MKQPSAVSSQPGPPPAPAGLVTVADVCSANALGSSFEGCEETNECFIPSTVTIDLGGTVTWENTDNAAHTATSGTPGGDDVAAVWDSSLMMVGQSYSHTFNTPGTYDYFCMVHPWMQGSVVVEAATDAAAAAAAAAALAASVAASDAAAAEAAEAEAAAAIAALEAEQAAVESSGIEATVQNAPGSSFEGCEETNSCFLPYTVIIDLGGTVTWENPDNAAHSTTSFKGSISGVIGLEWDSGL